MSTRAAALVRALRAHEHRTAAGLLLLLIVVYLWPALIEGHVLAPTALLYLETPWSAVAPHGFLHWTNGDLGDVPLSYYPWEVLARTFIHSGTFPAWNPYAFTGTPLFANVELAWASPFSLPLWILPFPYALGVAAALKLWVAGFGTYLLIRELKLGFWPAMAAAAGFSLCAFDVVWLSHGVFVSVAAMLPWSVWLTERLIRRGEPLDGLALAAVAAVALTGGHPGTQVHVLSATVLYALVRAATVTHVGRRERLARLGLVGIALSLGALLTAVLLLPGQLTAHGTVGAVLRQNGSPKFPSAHLTPAVLKTALFPDWWGRPSEQVLLGPSVYRERTFYAGAVSLLLALIALVSPRGWRRKAPFVVLAAVGAIVALRTPGVWWLTTHAPPFDEIQNGRAVLLFTFGVPVLAAFGLQALLEGSVSPKRLSLVVAACLAAGLAAIASLSLSGRAVEGAVRQIVHRSAQVTDPASLALASAGWWMILVTLAGAIVFVNVRHPRRRALAGGALALLIALDMLHFAHGYQSMGSASKVVPPQTPAIAYLQRHVGDGRIVGIALGPDNWTLAADWSSVYGLRDARGFDAPFPTVRYYNLWKAIDPTAEFSRLNDISPVGVQLLGLLGVRYIVMPRGTVISRPGVSLAYNGADARIYRDDLALPRAFAVFQASRGEGEAQELAVMTAGTVDPQTEAVVDGTQPQPALPRAVAPGSTVAVVRERDDEVELRANLTSPGLVVLDEQWAPGWSVEVDGRPARALRTDLVLRGVAVPAGAHRITWTYRVPGLRLGAALSAAGLAIALAWAGWLLRRRSRRRAAATAPPARRRAR